MIDFESTFKISLRSLYINKMRSILTSLGIIIGVSAVIIMLSIGEGAKERINKDIASMGSNLLMVLSGSTTSSGVRMGSGTQPTLTIKDSEAMLKRCPSVLEVAPTVGQVQQLVYSNQNWSTTVNGITPGYMPIRMWEIESGRGISQEDLKNTTKVAVLGSTVTTNLFGDMDPINRTIRIGGMPFKVIGILKSKGQNGMGQDQDDTVLIPITTAQKKLFGTDFPGMVKHISVQAKDEDSLDSAQEEITELLRERHNLGKTKEDDFTIRNFTQMLETAKQASNTMAILLGSIASVSLLVGGIGIMNIMLVSVTERTKRNRYTYGNRCNSNGYKDTVSCRSFITVSCRRINRCNSRCIRFQNRGSVFRYDRYNFRSTDIDFLWLCRACGDFIRLLSRIQGIFAQSYRSFEV